MQTMLTAKQGAMGRVCASRTGKEQPGNKNTDGCWQHCLPAASWDTATAHTAVNSTTPVCVMVTEMRENTLQEQSMGWLGYETIFFPGFGWNGEWHSSLSLRIAFQCSSHITASCRSMLCYSTVRGAAQTLPQHFHFPPSRDLYK